MKLRFSHSLEHLDVLTDDGQTIIKTFWAASHVRNELTGERPEPGMGADVVTAFNKDLTDGPPVQSRPFPLGTWGVKKAVPTTEKWLQPIKLITDAHQLLGTYKLDSTGHYAGPTGKYTDDWGYAIHFCNGSVHTDGCIGIKALADLQWIVANVQLPTTIEVVA